jgi:hypothetical protein
MRASSVVRLSSFIGEAVGVAAAAMFASDLMVSEDPVVISLSSKDRGEEPAGMHNCRIVPVRGSPRHLCMRYVQN